MTVQNPQNDSLESRLKESQVENELLLVQVHQLEEELEHYFKRNRDLESRQQVGSASSAQERMVWVDEELPDTIAENQRLRALVQVQKKTHELESNNALNVKLGNILVQGVGSPRTLFAVPFKIAKIWRESSRMKPPKSLGGKEFAKIITVYNDGGFKAVEKQLADNSTVATMQANAYTALARELMKNDYIAAAEAARSAYELDPKPFRLKWLAFRLHDAGEIIEAEAMLDILPPEIKWSESEARQASQLRNEGIHARLQNAKNKTEFCERRADAKRQLNKYMKLTRELDKKIKQLTSAKVKEQAAVVKEIEYLSQVRERQERDNDSLLNQLFRLQEEFESSLKETKNGLV